VAGADGKLAGKVALVTGSTLGIGRATARLFAAEGARVVVNGLEPEEGERTIADIRSGGGEAVYFHANVGAADELRALVEFAVRTYGPVDVLMNNAFSGRGGSATEMDEADWDRHLAVSLKAVYLGSKLVLPQMIKRGGGAIVNTSSVHGLLAARRSVAYETAKAGIINLTRSLAVDYGPHDVRVNAICPGRIVTERKQAMLDRSPLLDRRDKLFYPLRRFGETADIAKAALFLASDDAAFVTGHALVVDGGLTAQLQDSLGAFIWDEATRETGENRE